MVRCSARLYLNISDASGRALEMNLFIILKSLSTGNLKPVVKCNISAKSKVKNVYLGKGCDRYVMIKKFYNFFFHRAGFEPGT